MVQEHAESLRHDLVYALHRVSATCAGQVTSLDLAFLVLAT
jgi:hypothetical protein